MLSNGQQTHNIVTSRIESKQVLANKVDTTACYLT